MIHIISNGDKMNGLILNFKKKKLTKRIRRSLNKKSSKKVSGIKLNKILKKVMILY